MARKIGDIIEFTIRIDILMPEGEKNNNSINVDDYERVYNVSYTINDTEESHDYFLNAEPGMIPPENDIKTFVSEIMPLEFKEVTDYEIIELYDAEYDLQSAKVVVKAVEG